MWQWVVLSHGTIWDLELNLWARRAISWCWDTSNRYTVRISRFGAKIAWSLVNSFLDIPFTTLTTVGKTVCLLTFLTLNTLGWAFSFWMARFVTMPITWRSLWSCYNVLSLLWRDTDLRSLYFVSLWRSARIGSSALLLFAALWLQHIFATCWSDGEVSRACMRSARSRSHIPAVIPSKRRSSRQCLQRSASVAICFEFT